jgi:hypothetical protein
MAIVVMNTPFSAPLKHFRGIPLAKKRNIFIDFQYIVLLSNLPKKSRHPKGAAALPFPKKGYFSFSYEKRSRESLTSHRSSLGPSA